MVVISIIALLSSVVLAAISTARERALVNKTVAEMKSLQGALELYRNANGYYPGNGVSAWYDDDEECNVQCGQGFETYIQSVLVTNKYIAKVPHSPYYPNNCTSTCYYDINKGYILGYTSQVYDPTNPNYHYTCNREKIKNYALYFYANTKKLNLPVLEYYDNGTYRNAVTWAAVPPVTTPYIYCLSM